MIVTSAQSPAPTAAATSPAMKPIGRFSPTSAGRAGFGGVTVRGAAAVRGRTGPVNARRAAGGRRAALQPDTRRPLLFAVAGSYNPCDPQPETPAIHLSPPAPHTKIDP